MAENVNGAGAGEGQASASGGESQQQQQQQNAPGGGQQPVADAGGGQGNGKSFSYKEDRTDWLPRSRYNEAAGKLTAAEQRAIAAEERATQAERRVQALAGVNPVNPQEAQTEEIREVMYAMFPQLKANDGLTADEMQEIKQAAAAARGASQATWERHAQGMLDTLGSEVSDSLGVEKLNPTQTARLQSAYREEAWAASQARQAALQRGERESMQTTSQDNDFLARHERGDKTLITEFAKAFLDDWYEPARRRVASTTVQRNSRPVPRGERTRTQIATGTPKIDYNDKDAFKKALIEARNSGA